MFLATNLEFLINSQPTPLHRSAILVEHAAIQRDDM